MAIDCSVIIVTHNSQKFMPNLMAALDKQTVPADRIILVDSGSNDISYLLPYRERSDVVLVFDQKDIGFCKGNNLGMQQVPANSDYVLFLNPDAFLEEAFLEKAIAMMEDPANSLVGILTGPLLGYDIQSDKPTGKYDSTGIFCTWYGRWFDRAQGTPIDERLYNKIEEVPAICGALMFCRKKALDSILLRGKEVFDNTFYMYKEDIDLSLRIRRKGWKLLYAPQPAAYHCRGWNSNRKLMPRKFRLCSARNELRIHARSLSPCALYSLAKYAAVKILDK